MRQYLLPKAFHKEAEFPLSEKDSHYLTKVLRYEAGTHFNGIDSEGTLWDLILTDHETLLCTKAQGSVQATSDTMPSFTGPYPRIRLYQCLCKGKKDESIVRQATEIGVESITFVSSKFCTVDLSGKNAKAQKARTERMEAIIKEAIQQSGSPIPTHYQEEILSIEQLCKTCTEGTALFFHQDKLSTVGLSSILKDAQEPISVLVGSEGGLSDDECSLLLSHGFHPVLLKTNILRAETAAVYALAAIQTLRTETND